MPSAKRQGGFRQPRNRSSLRPTSGPISTDLDLAMIVGTRGTEENLRAIPGHFCIVEMSPSRKRSVDRLRVVALGERVVMEESGAFPPTSARHFVTHVQRLGPVRCPGKPHQAFGC